MASRLKGILPRFVIFAAVGWAAGVHRRTKKLTRQDDLTGALNRRGFFEVLGDESKRSQRYLHPLTVVYVDLDDFKLVNDLQRSQNRKLGSARSGSHHAEHPPRSGFRCSTWRRRVRSASARNGRGVQAECPPPPSSPKSPTTSGFLAR